MSDGQVISARSQPTDVVSFTILLNQTAMNGEYKLIGLYATKGYNRISSAKIIISDGDPSLPDFAISSKENALTPGNEIEIAMGYHSNPETIFKGIIVKHAIKAAKGQPSVLTIEAKDKAIKLTKGRKSQTFINKTDADIIKAIAAKSSFDGPSIDVAATTPAHKQMVQNNTMDWDFIVSRAEMNGMLVLTDDNKLIIKKPDTGQHEAKEIVFGTDVLEFEFEIDADSQLKKVKSHSWSHKDQKLEDSPEASIQFTESGNLKGEDLAGKMGLDEYNLYHAGSLNNEELKAWSDAQLLKSMLAKTAGRITIIGTAEIKVGNVIKLSGFSERFNGNVLVTSIRQSFHSTHWETDVQFGLPQQWFHQRDDIIYKPAGGLVPGTNGLQIGIVVQLENDPDNEDRIKIKLPLIDLQEGIWARVSSLDAGNNRGSFFRPEINDEVLVGFLNDDPRHAVVLGMLHSSAKPAPVKVKDTNHDKGFVTRSNMKLMFEDDKKIITIETPKGKKIEINEDTDSIVLSDQNNNKISMTPDGITIESPKNISIKSSGGDVKIDAINIAAAANAKFSAKGTANAELQSSGPTIVKGAMVNIN